VYSPNLTWFLLACGVWWIAPYRLQDSLQEIWKQRLIVNHVMVFGYVGFWHVACYWWQWAKRPFAANRPYSPRTVIHNIFYTWLGILQWTLTEVAILYCYQTNRIPFLEQQHPTMFHTAVASLLVPAFRDVHFYFTHRFLHTSFMYKYIHSVHHRNTTDIEPFSGLCMHPVEHLYYFTCYAPCLFFKSGASPFILFWMGVHTILSPAASHSGFEDHFSSDVFHYLHHRYSDCNYGGAPLLDRWFGTYRDQWKGDKNTKTIPNNHKASLGFLPEHAMFQLSCLGLVVLVGWCYYYESSMNHYPRVMAFLLSTGPCWIALGLFLVKHRKHQSLLAAPFDKKNGPALVSLVFHTIMGILFGILPATYLMAKVLSSPPQQS
jgi:sterol desaturase/sphingolipid hydroxylase (fatty acid hydroxylase superfamily)